MDHPRPQTLDSEAEEKWSNPEIGCSVQRRGRTHTKAEKKDSGIGSDRSVSPPCSAESTKKSISEPAGYGGGNSDERTKKIKTHSKLERMSSVLWEDECFPHSRAVSVLSLRSNNSKRHPPSFSVPLPGCGVNEALSPELTALSVKSYVSMENIGNLHREGSLNTSSGSNLLDMEQLADSAYPVPSEVSLLNEAKEKLKERYKDELNYIFVKAEKHSCPILLNDVYVEPYITQEEGEESPQHEIRESKAMSKQVQWSIFSQSPEQQKSIRTQLIKGIARMGKTIYVRKFVLDWAEGKTNQEIDLILTLPLQDLNLRRERVSLTKLFQHFFPEVKHIDLNAARIILFFDGLDEYHFPLDFQHNTNWTDPTKPTTVDVLLTNLIKGNLLPSALLWITSRPWAANTIPAEYIQRVTNIHGFKDAQKEEYFHKRISDQTKAHRVIAHIKTSRVFNRMCHIPAYCSLSASILQDTSDETNPETLIQMLSSFLRADLQLKGHMD